MRRVLASAVASEAPSEDLLSKMPKRPISLQPTAGLTEYVNLIQDSILTETDRAAAVPGSSVCRRRSLELRLKIPLGTCRFTVANRRLQPLPSKASGENR